MASSTEQWSSDANEAIQISLIRPGPSSIETVQKFHPKFTYPIVGEEERIFGYKGLAIDVNFAAHDLRPSVTVSYTEKFPPVGDTFATDINQTLKEWLPAEAFAGKAIQHDSKDPDYTPAGRLLRTYSRKGKTYEIWAGSLLDARVREVIDRMQIFSSLFIEGGIPITTIDADWTLDRWTIFFVYEKAVPLLTPNTAPYSFIGYATTYRFWTLQVPNSNGSEILMLEFPRTKLISMKELPCRVRISQFLILPPYQHSGHGSALYKTIYDELAVDATVLELAVEDPSEEFDALRDVNDFRLLEPKFKGAGIGINVTPFPPSERGRSRRLPTSKLLNQEVLKAIRKENKIAKRQFSRVLEMFLLSLIPHSHRAGGGASLTKLLMKKANTPDPIDKAYYWWRLIVKQRIYKKNRDQLQQIDLEERQPKVEEAARALEDEYEFRLLAFAALASKDLMHNGNGSAEAVSKPLQERKRKIVEDDDDDDEDDRGATARSGSKKAKV